MRGSSAPTTASPSTAWTCSATRAYGEGRWRQQDEHMGKRAEQHTKWDGLPQATTGAAS